MTAASPGVAASKRELSFPITRKEPRALDLAFDVDTGNSRANHMLLIMARLGNRTLRCYASEKTLADRCGFSVSTASRAIDYLKSRSFIKQVICHPRKRKSCTYALCIDLWITRKPVRPRLNRGRSNCAFHLGQPERQNHEPESGSQRATSGARATTSVGARIAPLIVRLTRESG